MVIIKYKIERFGINTDLFRFHRINNPSNAKYLIGVWGEGVYIG